MLQGPNVYLNASDVWGFFLISGIPFCDRGEVDFWNAEKNFFKNLFPRISIELNYKPIQIIALEILIFLVFPFIMPF